METLSLAYVCLASSGGSRRFFFLSFVLGLHFLGVPINFLYSSRRLATAWRNIILPDSYESLYQLSISQFLFYQVLRLTKVNRNIANNKCDGKLFRSTRIEDDNLSTGFECTNICHIMFQMTTLLLFSPPPALSIAKLRLHVSGLVPDQWWSNILACDYFATF